MTLTFLPLIMRGKDSKSERALKSLDLAENIKDRETRLDCMSIIYVLLDKFGDLSSKKKLKERISMIEIGRMIRDEGKKEGKAEGKVEGKKEGKTELVIKLLIKKFKKVPNKYIDQIKSLSDDTLDVIATDIFDMDRVEDLERYF